MKFLWIDVWTGKTLKGILTVYIKTWKIENIARDARACRKLKSFQKG